MINHNTFLDKLIWDYIHEIDNAYRGRVGVYNRNKIYRSMSARDVISTARDSVIDELDNDD